MMGVIIATAAWIGCGVIAYGRTFADFQKSFPKIAKKAEADNRIVALFMGVMGPFGLLTSLIHGKRGMMFRSIHKDHPHD